MRPSLLASLALLLVALGACAPDRETPVDMVVLVYNPSARVYEPRRVQLHTVTDVVSMSGAAANFITGAEIAYNQDDPALQIARQSQDADKVATAMLRDEGGEAEVAFIDSDGVLVPSDFHSLNLATTYYNLERAFAFFGRVSSLRPEDFGAPKVYYFPNFTLDHREVKDNAVYVPIVQSMLILPFEKEQQIPMAINMGIVGHELGHNLMNYLVHDRSLAPATEDWSAETIFPGAAPGANLLASLEEGYADLWGTGVTCTEDLTSCNTAFIGQSVDSQEQVRRVDEPHCLSSPLVNNPLWNALQTYSAPAFAKSGLPYRLGSVFASAVWAATEDPTAVKNLGPSETRKQVYKALYRSLNGDGTQPSIRDLVTSALPDPNAFHLESRDGRSGVLDAVVGAASDGLIRDALCRAFLDHFKFNPVDIAACPPGIMPSNHCN